MNLLLISLFAVASLSVFPTKTFGSTEVEEQEPPLALSLSSIKQQKQSEFEIKHDIDAPVKPSDNVAANRGEIWQEDEREVLIRNERGAKKNKDNNNNGGTGGGANAGTSAEGGAAGKKGKNKKTNKYTSPDSKQQEQSSCRYAKSSWTECDAKSNTRSRTLTLKKGDEGCVQTRTIQKKCKKACRYEKGTWSECTTGQMSRTDELKTTSDITCQKTRIVNKNCNPGKVKGEKGANNKERPAKNGNKDKGGRKGRA